MARAGVNYHDVTQAAEAILDAGLEPTIDRVREQLRTGSKSTLAPLLKRWKEQRETVAAGQGLPADLVAAVKGLHDRMQQSAAAQIEAARLSYAENEAALCQQLADREQAFTVLQERHQTLEAEHADLREAHRKLIETHQHECSTTAALRAEVAELRARLTDTQAAGADLKQELRQARDNAEHYQQAVAEERRLEREHVQQLKSEWQAAREDWSGRLTAETAARQAAETEVRQLLARNQQLERLDVEQQAELERRQSELQRDQQLLEELKPQLQALHEKQLQAAADIAQLRTQKHHLETVTTQQEQRIQQLETHLTKAEDRITHLLDENRFLQQEKTDLQQGLRQLTTRPPRGKS